jgi:hypothetical protein
MASTRPAVPFLFAASAAALLASACGGGGGGGDHGGGGPPPTSSLFVEITATSLPATLIDEQCMDATALDYDGDGDLDLALALEFHRNGLMQNDGSGRFTDVSAAAGMLANGGDHEGMTAADLDGDADLDLVFAGEDDGVHELYLDLGTTFTGRTLTQSQVANDVIAFDVDGDGDRDLLFGGQGLLLLINDGAANFTADASGRMPGTNGIVQDLVALDLDGDGDLDLALGIEGQNQVLRNDGTGRFADATSLHLPSVVDETRVMAFADVDRDGDQDLFVGNVLQELPGGASQNFLHLNDGGGRFSAAPAGRLPATFGAYGASFVDFDADGDPDLLLANADLVDGTNLVGAQLLRNDGAGAFTDITTLAFGGAVREHFMGATSGDFDRDGKTDLFLCARGTFVGSQPTGFRDRLLRQQ